MTTNASGDAFKCKGCGALSEDDADSQQPVGISEKWEYMSDFTSSKETHKYFLNKHGRMGWQLCATSENGRFYFKRPIEVCPMVRESGKQDD